MIKRLNLLLFSILFYSCSILNIYLVVKFILADEILYPVLFWVLFGIDKILIFIAQMFSNMSEPMEYTPLISDIFQLGTLYVLFSNQLPKKSDLYSIALIFKSLPLLLIQTVVYFTDNGILQNPSISDTDLALTYINYIILIFIAVICCQMIFKTKGTFFVNLAIPFTGYLLQSSLFLITQDSTFINLGYLHFLLILTETIILFIQKKSPQTSKNLTLTLLSSLCFVSNSSCLKKSLQFKRHAYILSYFNNLTYFILLCMIGTDSIFSSENSSSPLPSNAYDTIQSIHCKIAFIFGASFLVYFAKQFLQAVFTYNSFCIVTKSDLQETLYFLKQPHKYLRNIHIDFLILPNLKDYEYLEQFLDGLSPHQECFLLYKLFKQMNKFSLNTNNNNKLTLKQKQYPLICQQHSVKIYSNQWDVAVNLKSLLNNNMNLQDLLGILRSRIENGMILSPLSLIIIKQIMNHIDVQWIFRFLAQFMQITMYHKVIAKQMVFSSPQVLYDLYVD